VNIGIVSGCGDAGISIDRWIESKNLYSIGRLHISKDESYGCKMKDGSCLMPSKGDDSKKDPSKNGEDENASR
jgi:hypothetical protein